MAQRDAGNLQGKLTENNAVWVPRWVARKGQGGGNDVVIYPASSQWPRTPGGRRAEPQGRLAGRALFPEGRVVPLARALHKWRVGTSWLEPEGLRLWDLPAARQLA